MSLDRDLANFLWLGLGGSKRVSVTAVVPDHAQIRLALGAPTPAFERVFARAVEARNQMQVQ